MILSITSIKLKRWYYYFKLTSLALSIVQQLKKNKACADFKNKTFSGRSYTMSLWESEEAIDAFYKSGAHALAMKSSAKIASELQFVRLKADGFPDWKEAVVYLNEHGRTQKI